jgi:hypothetical protein
MGRKRTIRQRFGEQVFARAGYRCEVCGVAGVDRQATDPYVAACEGAICLDAHHITDRHRFRNGGYVRANGITLCDACHVQAERYHATGVAIPGYAPDDLYGLINSSFARAAQADAGTA